MGHVADGVDVDERADAGDEQHEHRATAGRAAARRPRGSRPTGIHCTCACRPPVVLPLDGEEQDDRVDEQRHRHQRTEQVPHGSARGPTEQHARDSSGMAMSSQRRLDPGCGGHGGYRSLSTSAGSRRRPTQNDGCGRWP